ncbi:zinc-binding dehydrogenase [Microbispora sp. CA-102843]|uniref:zinc-binding dehydrogenase n=1 Tax=Microbispora sp. CA-102843 TaxID=3239952 RepID=UPI003D906C61
MWPSSWARLTRRPAALLEEGSLRVGLDSVFPLAEAARAHERAERGHIQGKIVLRVVPDRMD